MQTLHWINSWSLFSVYNVNSSEPVADLNLWEVRVEFDEELFNYSTNMNIKLSSNCTSTIQVEYNQSIRIPIPKFNITTEVCHYTIQLMNEQSQNIGYPVLGFFQYSNYEGKSIIIIKPI